MYEDRTPVWEYRDKVTGSSGPMDLLLLDKSYFGRTLNLIDIGTCIETTLDTQLEEAETFQRFYKNLEEAREMAPKDYAKYLRELADKLDGGGRPDFKGWPRVDPELDG